MTTSTNSIVEVIQHYQRSIDSSQDNEARLLHCIQKLYKLPIKVEHLQETGVGKTVNSLRKFNGEIGVAAKALVTKWKAMVAAAEEPMDTTPQSNDNEAHDNNNDYDETPHNGLIDEDDENQNTPLQQSKPAGDSEREKQKDSHRDKSQSSKKSSSSSSKNSNEKHKSSSSSRDKDGHAKHSSHSSKEREKEKTEHKSRDRHKDQGKDREHSDKHRDDRQKTENEACADSVDQKKNNGSNSKTHSEDKHSNQSSSKEKERTDKHKSSSKDKERSKDEKSSSSKDKHDRKTSSSSSQRSSSSTKECPDTSERKRRHNSDTESSDFKSPNPKVAKAHKSSSSTRTAVSTPPPDEENVGEAFDSSMGGNFGDILGMLDVPMKKGKKSGKSSSVSSSCSSKDTPVKPSTSNNSAHTKVNGMHTSPTIFTSKLPTVKPDLLAPTAKLEPLDPSIALELPTISTNYKPMPLNQTVMDCVFNTASSSASRAARAITDAEAYQHAISSKTMRTKIYSGTRTGQIYQVPSLFDMCIRILQKNIDALEYTGGVPFEVLKPVLERATPQQLFVFEDYNPYLMEDSDILWQFHVSKNCRSQKRLENESWREMYMRCEEERERKLNLLKDSIKQSQKIQAAPVRKTQMAFLDSMVKPPRNVVRKQEQFGTKSKMVATPAARVAALQSVTPNAAKTGDQRLKVPSTVRDHAQVSSSVARPKKAPLMQKTLAFIRGRLKR